MNADKLADKIRRFGLGFIGAICSIGVIFGARENKPVIVLASVLVFSLTHGIMQEITNRKEDEETTDNA